MKVAFFLDNSAIQSVDCSQVVNSNPGIGGTEYLILCTSTLLSSRDNGIDVHLYCTREAIFPPGLEYTVVKDITDAMATSSSSGYNTFITKHIAENVTNDSFSHTPTGLRVIIWCHIFMSYWEMDYYATKDNVERIVFVGRETADLYRDHFGFKKCTYIFNSVNCDGLREKVAQHPFRERDHIVTYIGSLVPYKGFHLLAEAWPTVLKAVPDAELYVIGSGKLYDSNAKLGRFGLAEEEYEDSFITPLINADGNIIPSVHFMGKMGVEKYDILIKTKVGVPNPSGITETFCLSAVEMQASGAKVTTINYPGFIDTVKNGTLYSNRKYLAKHIISLLLSKDSSYENTMAFFEDNFSYSAALSQWESMLTSEKFNDLCETIPNKCYRLKILKEIRRRASQVFPILYKLPITERMLLFAERKIKGYYTYLDS